MEVAERSIRVYTKSKDPITVKQYPVADRWLKENDEIICIRRRKEFLFFVWDENEEDTLRLVEVYPIPKDERKKPKRLYAGY
jgi:hypothetical protein